LNLERPVERRDVRVIDSNSGVKKREATFIDDEHFFIVLGDSRACADFWDSADFSRFDIPNVLIACSYQVHVTFK